jgi:ELWxxDGT repeat protein
VGERFFFLRTVGTSPGELGRLELWRTDGTEAGTARVTELGPESLFVEEATPLGHRILFSAEDPEHGRELWVTDGTARGTGLLKDISPGPASSRPLFLTPAGGVLYFSADEPGHGRELWRTDGTARGTKLVEDARRGPESSGAQPLTVFEQRLYFATYEPHNRGVTLHNLNPAPNRLPRPRRVAFIANPYAGGAAEVSVFVSSFAVSGSQLFFTLFYDIGSPAPRETQLWRTDGTREGTRLLYAPLIVSPDLAVPRPVPTGDGRVIFHAFDDTHGHEPWVSDGTVGGTRLLQDIGPGSSYPQELLGSDGFAYFVADDGVHGREVWALPLPSGTGHSPR